MENTKSQQINAKDISYLLMTSASDDTHASCDDCVYETSANNIKTEVGIRSEDNHSL
jgi:hypothetical protein